MRLNALEIGPSLIERHGASEHRARPGTHVGLPHLREAAASSFSTWVALFESPSARWATPAGNRHRTKLGSSRCFGVTTSYIAMQSDNWKRDMTFTI
jgi:hypothetical protein